MEILTSIGLTTSLALGATACNGSSHKAEKLVCTGLEFAAPKGGPGSVEMYVFPVLSKKVGAVPTASFSGKVISGDSAGEIVVQNSSEPRGQFNFSWDEHSNDTQTAVVEATVEVNGQKIDCTPTELHWDPNKYKVSPGVPGSPY